MTLHQLAKSIVASLWHNSIEEFRTDGIVKNYEKQPKSLSEFLNDEKFSLINSIIFATSTSPTTNIAVISG